MAVVMKMVAAGATPEQYDELNEALGVKDDAPDGLIMHMAGHTDDGMMVVDVWESAEKLQAFFDDRLGAALAASPMNPSEPEIHQLHNMIPQGAGTEDGMIVAIELDTTSDVYDEMLAKMPSHADGGAGHPVTAHIAAVGDDGKLYIFDLWESAEAFAAFAEDEIAPNAHPDLGEVNPQFHKAHNVIRGSASVPAA
jgi:heme-degrading monooxygenase HmoA